jgi:hypothetical protein
MDKIAKFLLTQILGPESLSFKYWSNILIPNGAYYGCLLRFGLEMNLSGSNLVGKYRKILMKIPNIEFSTSVTLF